MNTRRWDNRLNGRYEWPPASDTLFVPASQNSARYAFGLGSRVAGLPRRRWRSPVHGFPRGRHEQRAARWLVLACLASSFASASLFAVSMADVVGLGYVLVHPMLAALLGAVGASAGLASAYQAARRPRRSGAGAYPPILN